MQGPVIRHAAVEASDQKLEASDQRPAAVEASDQDLSAEDNDKDLTAEASAAGLTCWRRDMLV